MLLGDVEAIGVPLVAHLFEEPEEHQMDEVARPERQRQPVELALDGRRVKGPQCRQQPARALGHRGVLGPGCLFLHPRGGRRRNHRFQLRVGQGREAADGVAAFDGGGEQLQALHVGTGVEAAAVVADRRHDGVPAFPCPQRVDAQAGQARDGADRVARRRAQRLRHRLDCTSSLPSRQAYVHGLWRTFT